MQIGFKIYYMNPALRILKDDVAARLDELALLSAVYKSNRDAGLSTYILRRALLCAAEDALMLAKGQEDVLGATSGQQANDADERRDTN